MNWYRIAQINLLFEHIHNDYYNGQNDYTLLAKDINGNTIGTILYSEYEEEIFINDMNVKENLRRQGIGTQMVEELKREYDVKVNWGYMSGEGSALYDSMDNPTNELE